MNLAECLRGAARDVPDSPFLVSSRRTVTYAAALSAAGSLAGGLTSRGIARFAVVAEDPIDTALLLCAGGLAGVEPCCYPRDLDESLAGEYAELLGHSVIVTDRVLEVADREVTGVDGLAGEPSLGSGSSDDDATVLILTTGTTGRPKAARHLWSRLLPAPQRTGPSNARWLLAYNLNQFAGIQVFLQVLASRAALVVPESNQPRQALAAMRDLAVTHASGTPTFWRFACSLLGTDDAPSLEQITIGGEAVPESLLTTLADHFPGARISQIYASTELGSTVSVRDGRPGLPLAVLDRGPDSDVQFRIVEGELYARSSVGMLGYHDQDGTADDWRATGDLVEIDGDRIRFVGRVSEVINVGGVKVAPLPIESAISAVDGVDLAHVYGRPNAVTGQIVVVDVVARKGVDKEALEDSIREACEVFPRAAQPKRVRFVEDLGVRENKIVRSAEASPS